MDTKNVFKLVFFASVLLTCKISLAADDKHDMTETGLGKMPMKQAKRIEARPVDHDTSIAELERGNLIYQDKERTVLDWALDQGYTIELKAGQLEVKGKKNYSVDAFDKKLSRYPQGWLNFNPAFKTLCDELRKEMPENLQSRHCTGLSEEQINKWISSGAGTVADKNLSFQISKKDGKVRANGEGVLYNGGQMNHSIRQLSGRGATFTCAFSGLFGYMIGDIKANLEFWNRKKKESAEDVIAIFQRHNAPKHSTDPAASNRTGSPHRESATTSETKKSKNNSGTSQSGQ